MKCRLIARIVKNHTRFISALILRNLSPSKGMSGRERKKLVLCVYNFIKKEIVKADKECMCKECNKKHNYLLHVDFKKETRATT